MSVSFNFQKQPVLFCGKPFPKSSSRQGSVRGYGELPFTNRTGQLKTLLHFALSENQKATIFNMLEYMGAWQWYDGQIKLAQATVRTKKNKPVNHKGAAIHVLNRMQGLQPRPEKPGKWISGVGKLALGKEGDESGFSPENYNAGIDERARNLQRKRISTQLSRSQKLSTKLVKELGLGILFSPKIW